VIERHLPKQISLSVKDVIYLKSDGNYTTIYTKKPGSKTLVDLNLCEIQASLNSSRLIRINRGNLINVNQRTEVRSG
jgi:DNA-binding LytR/AlgR family response regulator